MSMAHEDPLRPPAAALPPPPRPSFYIVGAPRCGTSSMTKALARNPEICFSVPKETHFFLQDFGAAEIDFERDYVRRYFPHLREGHRVIGEGSVSYLYSPDAIRRVLGFDPDAKFIAMVRNPIDLVHSYHMRMVFTTDEDERDFARAWALQERRVRGESVPRTCRDPRLLLYGEVGRLGAHLERLLGVVPPGRCRVVVYDDLRADPIGVYRSTLAFVGVTDDGRTAFPRTRRNKGFQSGLLQRVVMNPPRWGARALGFHDLVAVKKSRVVRSIRQYVKSRNTFNDPRSPLDATTRDMLRGYFADDVAKLSTLLGRDLSHWR